MSSDIASERERVLAGLRRLSRTGKLRAAGLLARLQDVTGLGSVEIRQALLDLKAAGVLEYKADSHGAPLPGLLAVAPDNAPEAPHILAWREALGELGLSRQQSKALESLSTHLADMEGSDVRALAQAMARLVSLPREAFEDAGFNVSARHLMGSSKILRRVGAVALQELGLPLALLSPSPRYVLTAGPREPTAVLLVENPRAFENVIASGHAERVCVVLTWGFALSAGADRSFWCEVDGPNVPIQLIRCGTPPRLIDIAAHPNIFYWGDLDRAGLQIFRSLKAGLPQLRLSGIYAAMYPALNDPLRSHPYVNLVEKQGQAPITASDDPLEAAFAQLCARRAVDQEATTHTDIAERGTLAFGLDAWAELSRSTDSSPGLGRLES